MVSCDRAPVLEQEHRRPAKRRQRAFEPAGVLGIHRRMILARFAHAPAPGQERGALVGHGWLGKSGDDMGRTRPFEASSFWVATAWLDLAARGRTRWRGRCGGWRHPNPESRRPPTLGDALQVPIAPSSRCPQSDSSPLTLPTSSHGCSSSRGFGGSFACLVDCSVDNSPSSWLHGNGSRQWNDVVTRTASLLFVGNVWA